MRDNELTDLEKQELLQTLFVNKIYAPGLDRMVTRIAESISDVCGPRAAIAMASRYLAIFGKHEEADVLVRHHLHGAAEATALASIASEVARSNASQAAEYLQEASDILQEVQDPDDRVSLIQRLVDAHLNLNQNKRAWNIASQIHVPAERVYTLTKIAKRLWDRDDAEGAGEVLLNAWASAAETERNDRADALDDIARTLAHMKRESDAVSTWEEALTFVNESLDPPKLLLIICKGLASVGHRERAREVALTIQNEARRAQALALIEEQ